MAYTQADLQVKKVPELKTILTELGLATNGVKADLVSRILEHQKSAGEAGQSTTDQPAAGNKLGAIPADSELPSSLSASAAPANGGDAASAGASTATDPPPAYEDVATAGAEGTASTGATAGEAAAASLPDASATDKAAEAEKRAQRLKRFGGSEDIAKLERAERFGISGDAVDAKSVSALDSELSNKRIRTDKAGASAGAGTGSPASSGRGGGAQNGGKNGRPGLNRGQSASGKGKPQTKAGGQNAAKPSSKAAPAAAAKPAPPKLDPAEEEKRKQRAARFNAPAASNEAA